MVAGDIVNIQLIGVYPAGTTYQPAAGVELIVLQSLANTANTYIGIFDGATHAYNIVSTIAAASGNNGPYQSFLPLTMKLGITNTQYYKNDSGAANKGFSAIQTK